MSEPTLSEVHSDLVARLEQDKRLRAVEQAQAATSNEVSNLRADILRMEHTAAAGFIELKELVKDSKPKIWQAIAAIVPAIMLILVIAQRLYR